MALLERLHDERGTALVVITHEAGDRRAGPPRIELRDGVLVADDRRPARRAWR
jgi:ABC-type lipoprotein export system ATPase subunit